MSSCNTQAHCTPNVGVVRQESQTGREVGGGGRVEGEYGWGVGEFGVHPLVGLKCRCTVRSRTPVRDKGGYPFHQTKGASVRGHLGGD